MLGSKKEDRITMSRSADNQTAELRRSENSTPIPGRSRKYSRLLQFAPESNMALIRPQIILFGDSITEFSFRTNGWGALLVNEYARQADVVLRGYSGYSTRWAKYLLNKIFPIPSSSPPLLVTVFFGANDAVLPNRGCRQHVPLAEYKENLHRIVSHLKSQSDSTHIVLIAPPPVDIKGRQAYAREQAEILPERTNEVTGLYAEACEAVAQEEGVKVLKTWSIFQETADWEDKFLCDGLHLTPEGNIKLFDELQKLLGELGLRSDMLPWDFPDYLTIDSENPTPFEDYLD